MKQIFASLLGTAILVAGPSPAGAQDAPAVHAPEARIPFVNHGGIRNWREGDSDTLYVEDSGRHWYRVELIGPCFDLGFTEAIGVETKGNDTFDRFSKILVRGDRCQVRSLVAIPGQPPKKTKAKRS